MLKIYNTLSRSIEEFEPQKKQETSIYACGPTVYDYAHIGNFRTFTIVDFLVRTLEYLELHPKFIMNITDVGHLVSDADEGEDKLEKGAKREGKTAWDVAKFYEHEFLSDVQKLHLLAPVEYPKPTQLIKEQIEMIQQLEEKGYTYGISDGVYFDTSKLEDYGKLTGQNRDELIGGMRVELNPEKRNTTDFALWKLSPKDQKRDMEWDSPWGKGFPGWHIECSVMAQKYLGNTLDIHTGGADHIPVHHTNEIAQSEAATGEMPYVKYWFHVQFLQVDGKKMSKSKGNFYTMNDLIKKGFDPLALRYFFMTAHYRVHQNFTLEALTSAQQALDELRARVIALKSDSREFESDVPIADKARSYEHSFRHAISHDLNMPQALAALWEMIKSDVSISEKLQLVYMFDHVLGFGFKDMEIASDDVPKEVLDLAKQRDTARENKDFQQSDKLRDAIVSKGYVVEDGSGGSVVKKR